MIDYIAYALQRPQLMGGYSGSQIAPIDYRSLIGAQDAQSRNALARYGIDTQRYNAMGQGLMGLAGLGVQIAGPENIRKGLSDWWGSLGSQSTSYSSPWDLNSGSRYSDYNYSGDPWSYGSMGSTPNYWDFTPVEIPYPSYTPVMDYWGTTSGYTPEVYPVINPGLPDMWNLDPYSSWVGAF